MQDRNRHIQPREFNEKCPCNRGALYRIYKSRPYPLAALNANLACPGISLTIDLLFVSATVWEHFSMVLLISLSQRASDQ